MEENYDMRDVLLSNAAARNQKKANIKRILTAIAILFVLLLIILIIMKSINSGNINNEKTIVMPNESELNKPKVEQKQAIVIKKQQTQPSPQPTTQTLEPQNIAPTTTVTTKPSEYKETIVLKQREDELSPAKVEPKVETKVEQKVESKKEESKSTKVVVTADKNKKVEQPAKVVENKKVESKSAKTESKKTTQNVAKQTTKKPAQTTEKPSTKAPKVEKAEKPQNTQKVSGWLQVRSLPGHDCNIKIDPIYGKLSGIKYKLENAEVNGEKRTRVLIPYSSAEEKAKLKKQFPGAW